MLTSADDDLMIPAGTLLTHSTLQRKRWQTSTVLTTLYAVGPKQQGAILQQKCLASSACSELHSAGSC
jgi:hypothetical protein